MAQEYRAKKEAKEKKCICESDNLTGKSCFEFKVMFAPMPGTMEVSLTHSSATPIPQIMAFK
jgi:hypothetical protein